MGRRSKRLRSQLYQYAQDEAGSYSVITQWQPPPTTTTSTRTQRWSRRYVLTWAAVTLSCLALLAVGVSLGITQGGSADTPARNATPSSEPGSLWKAFNGREEEAARASSAPSSASHLGQFFKAAVATDGGQPCAHIATEILRKNGSAADAAIAGMFCVAVINAQSIGLGGGFLFTYYERATGKAYTLDAMTSDLSRSQEDSVRKGGVVPWVPGAVRGYRELYQRLGGRVPWPDLLEPSIRLCEEGHPVTPRLARALQHASTTIHSHPSMRVFVSPSSGEVYREGETIRRPQLARTLRLLQQDPDALYTGALAKDLVHDLDNMGASLTNQDLQGYSPSWEDPVSVRLRNGSFTLYSVGSPGSGNALGFLLNLIDEFGFTPGSLSDRNMVLTHHRLAEAFKWTLAKPVDATQLAHNNTSDDFNFAASIRRQILDDTTFHDAEHYGASPGTVSDSGAIPTSLDDCGTSQFSLLAPNGDAVSFTSAIYLCLGRWVRLPRTGMVVSWAVDAPSPRPVHQHSHTSLTTPERRAISPLTPAVVVDSRGEVVMVVGGTGGGSAPSGVWWAVLRFLWLGEDLRSAVDAPRFHLQMRPMSLVYERELSSRLVTGLQSLGHTTEEGGEGSAVYAIVREENGMVQAVSDHRREGGAVEGF